jgi:ribosomal-protein-alanine N-acetyltransferase
MDQELDIFLAKQSDCLEIADMSRTLIEHGLRWRWKPSRILQLICHPDCVVIAAKDRSGITGFAAMEFHEVHGHLNLLAVRPSERRLGIGRQLLSWLETSAGVAGLNYISLQVRSSNAGAIGFYQRAGYEINQLEKGYYNKVEDAYHMTHELISRDFAVQRP